MWVKDRVFWVIMLCDTPGCGMWVLASDRTGIRKIALVSLRLKTVARVNARAEAGSVAPQNSVEARRHLARVRDRGNKNATNRQ
jgi:hypothetical protein